MKLARYWTRQEGEATAPGGERIRVVSRGWSNESLEAAAAVARGVARKVAERIASGQTAGQRYGYGDRPLPEPVLREFRNGGDTPSAVVTRNSYGSLVLNARDLMFVDIDRESPPKQVAEIAQNLIFGLRSIFGKPAAPAPPPPPPMDPVVAGIRGVAERNGLGVRVYKTAAGYRVLITSAPFEAGSGQSESLLQQFGSDPLYLKLCRTQESFRARLTPKPWRCGLRLPPVSFPFETGEAEARFRDWEQKYTASIARFATCRYLGSFGSGMNSGFADLIEYHDQETKASAILPLA